MNNTDFVITSYQRLVQPLKQAHYSPAAVLGLAVLAMGLLGGCRNESASSRPGKNVAVTNPYLGAVVADLVDEENTIFTLSGPGMCPGHFDLRPGQIETLKQCGVLFRFDFQQGLDEKLSRLCATGLQIVEILPGHGLCNPQGYLQASRQVAAALCQAEQLTPTAAEQRLTEIETRLETLESRIRSRLKESGIHETAVICSPHQKDFCEWLGLRVVGTFSESDTASLGDINQLLDNANTGRVQWVIANRPEGDRAAQRLAEQLKAHVVVFDNFPDPDSTGPAFDLTVMANVDRLCPTTNP